MSRTDEAMAASNLALRLAQDGNTAAGIALHRRAIGMDPGDWRWKFSCAGSLINIGRIDEAEVLLTDCPAGDPIVMAMMAFVQWERGDAGSASKLFRLACRLRKHDPELLVAHAQSTLASGNWEHGFQFHECRPRRQELGAPIPRWDGKHVNRLLVWSDEGAGDAVMFARFIPQIAERVGRVVFGMPASLICLLGGYDAHAETMAMDSARSITADAEVPLMSLPMYCGTTPGNVPPDPGLLRSAPINGQLTIPGMRNVGIAWTGNQSFRRAVLRDMPLETMLGLAEDPDNQLFGLVVGSRAGDIARLGAQKLVMDMSGFTMTDFSATAAAIREMDAVVTTCNGIAHIAGALGVPTILCLATLPDWRWLEGRSDTPWYPSVTLVRQKKPREWGPVIAKAHELLAEMPLKGARPAGRNPWGEQ